MMRHLFYFCMSFALLHVSSLSYAQDAAKMDFTHTPVTFKDLPAPGKPIILTVIMKKDAIAVGMKVRALIARDGKLMEVQDAEPDIDTSDRAVYKMEVPSPLAEISYQFIFNDKLGQASSSKRYTAQRTCVPDVNVAIIGKGENTVTREDVGALVIQARSLERDIDLYERTITLLNEIHTAVEKK